jgi:UDP-sugar transporter A1/2/3
MGVAQTGIDLKWVSLITLVLQNTSIVLVMRYSRSASDDLYIASTAVVMGEFVKLFASLVIYLYEEIKDKRTMSLRRLYLDVFGSQSDWLKMTVPAILYFIQNNLQYNAITLVSFPARFINDVTRSLSFSPSLVSG